VAETERRLCVRFDLRADGTVVTQACGGALRLAPTRVRRFATAATAVALSAVLSPFGIMRTAARASATNATAVAPTVRPVEVQGEMACEIKGKPAPQVMGRMVAPAPQAVAVMGYIAPVPLMGAPAPLPAPPVNLPATRPAVVPPATQPTE
jgi:hypothetical protein